MAYWLWSIPPDVYPAALRAGTLALRQQGRKRLGEIAAGDTIFVYLSGSQTIAGQFEGIRDEIRSLVTRAFNVEREGQINKAELFMLLRLNFTDERWLRAMDAIRDAIRVIGAKQYFRFYERPNKEASWTAISIDLAKV